LLKADRIGQKIDAGIDALIVHAGHTVTPPLTEAQFLDTLTHFIQDLYSSDHGVARQLSRQEALADQWALLRNIRRVSEQTLDELIEINDLAGGVSIPVARHETNTSERTFGLLPCARRMLAEGVTSNQRVSCFRLAIQLKRAGMPKDLAIAVLKTWDAKNRPDDCRRILTEYEIIDQVRCAYDGGYRGRGCEEPAIREYCDDNCPLRKDRPKY